MGASFPQITNEYFVTLLNWQIENVVRLDNWINLEMDPKVAAKIVALRPALEALIVKTSRDPEQVLELGPVDVEVLNDRNMFDTIAL